MPLFRLVIAMMLSLPLWAQAANPQVRFVTNQGEWVVELYPEQAPVTVANFLNYVDEGAYSNNLFHRVIDGFMIQGGGYNTKLETLPTMAPIANEASNGLSNEVGTIAMARTNDPNSATRQFFINVANNNFLDAKPGNAGYAVFGKVIEGYEVVAQISKVATHYDGKLMARDVPTTAVVLTRIERVVNEEAATSSDESAETTETTDVTTADSAATASAATASEVASEATATQTASAAATSAE